MLKAILLFVSVAISVGSYAQKYTSEKGQITFFSDAAIEDIEALNNIVGSLFNAHTGELVYIVKIKDFVFEKSLMRDHFNEKYMESEKFPKASFQGKIIGYRLNEPGEQKVKAVGKLSMHGVTKEVEVPGTLQLANTKLILKSKFKVKLSDYGIKIPKLVWQNIAEEVEVKIDFIYKPV